MFYKKNFYKNKFFLQHGIQLKQNYEDTKAELPWLQLEEDLDDISLSSGAEVQYLPPRSVDAQKVASTVCTCIYIIHTMCTCMLSKFVAQNLCEFIVIK